MNAKISGIDEVARAFEKSPENLDKVLVKAFRAACKPAVKKVKSEVPGRFKSLVKGKVAKDADGNIVATIGMFNNQKANGHQNKGSKVTDWFKAYWKNYGTLSRRDPNHKFDRPVRSKHSYKVKGTTKSNYQAKYRRQDVGQPHENFFNEDARHYSPEFMNALKESAKKQEKDILK